MSAKDSIIKFYLIAFPILSFALINSKGFFSCIPMSSSLLACSYSDLALYCLVLAIIVGYKDSLFFLFPVVSSVRRDLRFEELYPVLGLLAVVLMLDVGSFLFVVFGSLALSPETVWLAEVLAFSMPLLLVLDVIAIYVLLPLFVLVSATYLLIGYRRGYGITDCLRYLVRKGLGRLVLYVIALALAMDFVYTLSGTAINLVVSSLSSPLAMFVYVRGFSDAVRNALLNAFATGARIAPHIVTWGEVFGVYPTIIVARYVCDKFIEGVI